MAIRSKANLLWKERASSYYVSTWFLLYLSVFKTDTNVWGYHIKGVKDQDIYEEEGAETMAGAIEKVESIIEEECRKFLA